jgi:hypothetical protein
MTVLDPQLKQRISAKKRAQVIDALKIYPNTSKVARLIGGINQVAVWKIAKAEGIELAFRQDKRRKRLCVPSRVQPRQLHAEGA